MAASTSAIMRVACNVTAALPRFGLDEYQNCKRVQAPNISACLALTPAATGSTTLARSLFDLPEASWYYTLLRSKTGFPLASHGATAGFYNDFARRHGLPLPACFIMTLRDPISRLESGFREELRTGGREVRGLHNTSMTGFLAAVRNATSYHAMLYRNSVAEPIYRHPETSAYPPLMGSHFLVSQVRYLRGLECDSQQIHFICTDRFDSEWPALLTALGSNSSRSRQRHERKRITHNRQRSRISEGADEALITETLYRRDAELYRMVCEQDAQPHDVASPKCEPLEQSDYPSSGSQM